MSEEDKLKKLREKLGVSRTGNTLIGVGSPTKPVNKPPPPTAAQDPLETTLQLSASDIELIEEEEAKRSQSAAPPTERGRPPTERGRPPLPPEPEPPRVFESPKMSEPPKEPEPPEPIPIQALEDTPSYYQQEAKALAAQQPDRGALMWIEAALAAERTGQGAQEVVKALEAALELGLSSPRVVALVRRGMLRLARYDRALQMTDQLVALGGDNSTRVAALLEAAAVKRHHSGDCQGALKLLGQAIDLHPGHVAALAMKAAFHLELGHDKESVEVLEQLAETVEDPQERSICLLTAGTILEFRLDDLDRAEQDYQRAVESDPENLFALMALRDLHHAQGRWRELCHDLERVAILAIDIPTKVRYLQRAGFLHLDRTGDLEAAARTLSTAASVAPEEMGPLSRLAYVHEETGRYEELVQCLWRLLELTVDPGGRPPLLTRIGWLLQFRLGQADPAIAAYRQAVSEQPGYLPALLALGTLYRQRGDYESLVAILTPEAEGTDPPDRRAEWCLEIAGVCATKLQQPDEAIRYYRRALELCPDMWVAFWRLQRLLVQLGRHDQLAELYSRQAQVATDSKTRAYILLQLARLHAGPLHQIDEAIQTLGKARGEGECRTASMELIELYERSGQAAELVELLLSEGTDTLDPKETLGRRLQAAAVLDENLGEHDRALEIYNEVLQQDPANVAATRAAGRIYYRLGRWKELLDLHRHELRAVPDRPDASELLYRIGRLYDEFLGQPGDAIAAYMDALNRDPSSTFVLDSLERLVRGEHRYGDLIGVLKRYAEARKEPFAAADALCRAAELADSHLGDLEQAVDLYDEALERSPAFRVALQGLLEVRLRQRSYGEAAAVLEQLIDGASGEVERSHLELRLARLREYRLEEQPDPALYDRAAAGSPYGSRLRGERLRARRLVGDGLAEALREFAAQALDPALAAAYWLHCAYLYEVAGKAEECLGAAEEAFRLAPEQPAAVWALERAVWRKQQWDRFAEIVGWEAEHDSDPATELILLSEAAHAFLRAGKTTEAAKCAEHCLELSARHLPSINLLARMAQAVERWEELSDLLNRLVHASESRENRLRAGLQASAIWSQRVGDNDRALEALQPALSDNPGQPDAFDRAERLLTTVGNFAQLSKLYARRIAGCVDPQEKIDLLRRHARLLHNKLGDPTSAISELGELLALRPDDLEALSERADLLCAQGRWSDAAETLAMLIEQADDAAQRRGARLLQAQVWLNQLHDPARAREVLEQAQKEEPGNISVKQGLVQVAFAQGRWDEARQLLDAVVAEDQPHLQVWALARLAEVAHIGMRDEDLRKKYEQQALLLAGIHPAVLEEMVEHYRRRKEQARLVAIAREVIAETTRADVASNLRLWVARILLHDLKQPTQALDNLRESLVRDPTDRVANLLYAQALEQQGEFEQAVARYRQLLDADACCVEAYQGLSRLMGLIGFPAVGTAALAVLDLLGTATPSDVEQIEAQGSQGGPSGRLEVVSIPTEPACSAIQRALTVVLPFLGPIYPLKLSRPQRPSDPVTLAASRLATALGLTGAQVSVEGDGPASAGVGDPVPLHVSAKLAAQPRSAAFRFWVGRAMAHSVLGGSLVDQLSDRELGELWEALFVQRPIDPVVLQLRKQVLRNLPRKARKVIEQSEPPRVDPELWSRYRAVVRQRSDQIGVLVSGNPRTALAELAHLHGGIEESGVLQEMLRFVVSEAYANYHRLLWTNLSGA